MRTILRAGVLGFAAVELVLGLWTLVLPALLAYLAFSVPHLMFHVGHLGNASSLEATVLVILLAASVVVPALLLAVAVRAVEVSPGPPGRR
jgi:hypothetical protein